LPELPPLLTTPPEPTPPPCPVEPAEAELPPVALLSPEALPPFPVVSIVADEPPEPSKVPDLLDEHAKPPISNATIKKPCNLRDRMSPS
jgi:hypothetical protein